MFASPPIGFQAGGRLDEDFQNAIVARPARLINTIGVHSLIREAALCQCGGDVLALQ